MRVPKQVKRVQIHSGHVDKRFDHAQPGPLLIGQFIPHQNLDLPRRCRVRAAFFAILDRATWVRPALAIIAATRLDFPCRRNAL
jgi:hypothetical protein